MTLLGEWLVTENSGTTLVDTVAANNLIVSANEGYRSVAAGRGIDFAGAGEAAVALTTPLSNISGTRTVTLIIVEDEVNSGQGDWIDCGYYGTANSRQIAVVRVDANLRIYYGTLIIATAAHGVATSAAATVIVVFDFDQSVAADRVKIYVNGSQVTTNATGDMPAQGTNIDISSATHVKIVSGAAVPAGLFYLAIESSALTTTVSAVSTALLANNDASPFASSVTLEGGGGGDFFRRRAIIQAQPTRWTPKSLSLVAWYYARREFVTLDANGLVSEWRDRGPLGFNMSAAVEAERATWEEAGGWNAQKSSISFPGGKNLGNSNALATMLNGTDQPFWLFCTCEVTNFTAANTIVSWDDLATARSQCYFSATNAFSAYGRTDDATSNVDAVSTTTVTLNTHRRCGWYFAGTTVSSYVDLMPALASAACDVGACTFSRLRIGDGIMAGNDSLVGRLTEIVIGRGVINLAREMPRYYAYSRGEWGA